MWRRGKKRTEESSADGDGGPSSKRAAKDDSDDPADGIVICELSKNRRVSVRTWNGKVVVDIREFYVKDGKTLPGKKGISLPMDQWNVLREHIEDINGAVADN